MNMTTEMTRDIIVKNYSVILPNFQKSDITSELKTLTLKNRNFMSFVLILNYNSSYGSMDSD